MPQIRVAMRRLDGYLGHSVASAGDGESEFGSGGDVDGSSGVVLGAHGRGAAAGYATRCSTPGRQCAGGVTTRRAHPR